MKKLLLLITFLFSIASFAHAQEGYSELKPRKVTFDLTKLSDDFIIKHTDRNDFLKDTPVNFVDDEIVQNVSISFYEDNAWKYYNNQGFQLAKINGPKLIINVKKGIILSVKLNGDANFSVNNNTVNNKEWKGRSYEELECIMTKTGYVKQIEVEYILDDKDDVRLPVKLDFQKKNKLIGVYKNLDLISGLVIEPTHIELSEDVISHIKFTTTDTDNTYLNLDPNTGLITIKGKNTETPIQVEAYISEDDNKYLPTSSLFELSILNENRTFIIDFIQGGKSQTILPTDSEKFKNFIQEGSEYIETIKGNNLFNQEPGGLLFGANKNSSELIITFDKDLMDPVKSIVLNYIPNVNDTKMEVNGETVLLENGWNTVHSQVVSFFENQILPQLNLKVERYNEIYLKSIIINFADITEPTEPEKVVLNLFEGGQGFIIENDHAYEYCPSEKIITTEIALSVTNTNFDVDKDLDVIIEPIGWSADSEAKALLNPDDKGAFNLSLQDIKSSGLYRVSFQSNNDKYVLAEPCAFTLNLYPSISGLKFVDGDYSYSAEGNVPYKFLYSEDENGEEHPDWLIDSRVAPVVELSEKNVEIWYKIEDSNSNGDNKEENTLRRLPADSELASMDFDKVDDENRINLRPIAENNDTSASYQINFVLIKNGASSPVDSDGNTTHFISFPSTNEPTGIDAISADDADVVYFNLQGVKVTRPERGIFIRIAGNKAEKVIL